MLAAELTSDEEEPAEREERHYHADDAEEVSPLPAATASYVHLHTGTCCQCGRANMENQCSRCQEVWFCNRKCQTAAWPAHKLNCFARSETAVWWSILGAIEQGRARDLIAAHQQCLEFGRAVASTRERRRSAASAAAAAAAAPHVQTGGKGGGKGKGQEDKEETCAVCQCEFTVGGDSGEALCCPSFHFLCSECTDVFVQSILNDLEAVFPPKCSSCRTEMAQELFERQLTAKQQERWNKFLTQRSLAASESMLKCECGYFEIRCDNPVLWWCKACQKGACQVCNKELPPFESDDNLSPESLTYRDQLLRPHLIGCTNLRPCKAVVNKTLEDCSKMPCPGCRPAGRKDDSCTHMTCPRCQKNWCYVCCMDVASCDKAAATYGRPINDIFLHNVDWEVNSKRCPMYLTQNLEVDPTWLGENWDESQTMKWTMTRALLTFIDIAPSSCCRTCATTLGHLFLNKYGCTLIVFAILCDFDSKLKFATRL